MHADFRDVLKFKTKSQKLKEVLIYGAIFHTLGSK
jgi:hypothetical protein